MNTRRKRHRASSSATEISRDTNCSTIKNENNDEIEEIADGADRGGYTLETLPPEVLEMILRLLPLGDVADSIRLVSRRCSTIATAVLNGAFVTAGTRLDATMNYIESTRLPRVATESDLLIWTRAFDVLELIKTQYKMLKAVTWRYTHPPKSANFHRLCFYAGTLLDELNVILDLARFRPRALTVYPTPANVRLGGGSTSYEKVITTAASSPRVGSFVALCKRFMNYFEKVSECKINRSPLVSGCKAVDVLDCLAVGREVTGFRISTCRIRGTRASMSETSIVAGRGSSSSVDHSEGTRTSVPAGNNVGSSIVTMGLRYVMRRAWFTGLRVPCAPDENSWREDQRFMYLRLRRLVGSVNEHYYEKSHYERDVRLRTKSIIAIDGGTMASVRIFDSQPPRPPPASTYSGYGVYAGRFFYYGNMNKYAYESKFKDLGDDAGVSSDNESGQEDEAIIEQRDNNENRNVTLGSSPPSFDLVVRVELRCSSELAPLAVISRFCTNDLDDQQSSTRANNGNLVVERSSLDRRDSVQSRVNGNNQENPEFYLKLSITCPASGANRLPSNFTWEQRGPAHSRRKRSHRQQRFSQ